jgi:long-chain acyl-CoA synthetase
VDNFKFGTVGLPLEGVEVRLAEDKEILIRGKTVMLGYYKDVNLTNEVLDKQSWFHTGDIGEIDSEGFLKIVDRKKDIIVTSSGKNIAPQFIENSLKASPFISEALVYGDKRNFLSALIVLDNNAISSWAQEKSLRFKDYADLTRKNEVIHLIEKEIEQINHSLAPYETIKKFAILDKELTQEGGELTPTMKIMRNKVIKKHQKLLDQFYKDRFN